MEEDGGVSILHLADGSTLRAKVKFGSTVYTAQEHEN
jgi:hypothetical protein